MAPIMPEMTIPDAVKIVRAEAAKSTGELRAALTMLVDLAGEIAATVARQKGEDA